MPMFPSYLRRDAMANAYGAVSSCRSNYANWEKDGKVGKVTENRGEMPCFYRNLKTGGGGMGEFDAMLNGETDTVSLRLCSGGTWQWYSFQLRHQDTKYLQKFWAGIRDDEGARACPPVPVGVKGGRGNGRSRNTGKTPGRRHHRCRKRRCRDRCCLRFPFRQTKDLAINDLPLEHRRILAVDLGVSCDATCSLMMHCLKFPA